jgi:hypothetical protein
MVGVDWESCFDHLLLVAVVKVQATATYTYLGHGDVNLYTTLVCLSVQPLLQLQR